jgi:hypothetical protein
MLRRVCAYCGEYFAKRAGGRDHVVPSCLYPPATSNPFISRITVPACRACNGGWSDDEPHFRDVMVLSSTANPQSLETWRGPTTRAFGYADGKRRAQDLLTLLEPAVVEQEQRFMIYPARDERVLRIVRKAARGLVHHHRISTAVPDGWVWADVQRYHVPPAFEADAISPRTDRPIFRYRYWVLGSADLHSAWLLTFYDNCTFLAVVRDPSAAAFRSDAA